jgi:hypothetical protein
VVEIEAEHAHYHLAEVTLAFTRERSAQRQRLTLAFDNARDKIRQKFFQAVEHARNFDRASARFEAVEQRIVRRKLQRITERGGFLAH